MRLVVDNPHPEPMPEPVGSPVGIAVMTVTVIAVLGSGALLSLRGLGAPVPTWTVLAPLMTGLALNVVIVVLGALDRRSAR